jgi:hypothetical protein
MKVPDKIQAILERELDKLNTLSALDPAPLNVQDIKSLDVLIKAHRSFVAPQPNPASAPADPAALSTEALLQGDLSDDTD